SLRYRRENANSNDPTRIADVAIGLGSKGDALLALDKAEEALKAYQESLEIRQEIAKKESNDVLRMADLARGFANRADALLKRNATNDAGAAVEDYRESVKIYENIEKEEPSNFYLEVDLAISRGNLGEGLLCLGNAEAALPLFRLSENILEQRMLVDSNNV